MVWRASRRSTICVSRASILTTRAVRRRTRSSRASSSMGDLLAHRRSRAGPWALREWRGGIGTPCQIVQTDAEEVGNRDQSLPVRIGNAIVFEKIDGVRTGLQAAGQGDLGHPGSFA